MATIFRAPRPLRRFGTRGRVLGKGTIATAVFAMAGVATVAQAGVKIDTSSFAMAGVAAEAGAGGSIATSTFAMAGVGADGIVGAGVKSGAFSMAGVASDSLAASAFYVTTLVASGVASISFATELRQITSTNIIQKPVNCVLAGQQTSIRPGRIRGGALRHAFGEPARRRR